MLAWGLPPCTEKGLHWTVRPTPWFSGASTNKAQRTGHQIHPPLWDKEGNLPPHSPCIVHFILEDHSAHRKHTQVQLTRNCMHTHLQYTVPTSSALVTYGAAQRSTYRLPPDPEGTAHTLYTWAQYSELPGPTRHQNPTWYRLLHGKRVPRQDGAKSTETTAPGGTTSTNLINPARTNGRMPLIHTGCLTPDDSTYCRTWGTIRQALHHDIDRDQDTWLDQGSFTIRAGGWLNSLNPKKLCRVAGPYIMCPVPRGIDGPCPGLRTGDPPCGHPCPRALFQPLPPQPAPLPDIYLNTVPGAEEVYLTTGATLRQAIPLHQIQHMAMGRQLPDTNKPGHQLAGRGARDPRPTHTNAFSQDEALLHLTLKPRAQLRAMREGEKHFIVEGLTDDVITLAANTLAAVTDTSDDAVGHPTERKDRVQENEDTLAPELPDHLIQLTSSPEQ